PGKDRERDGRVLHRHLRVDDPHVADAGVFRLSGEADEASDRLARTQAQGHSDLAHPWSSPGYKARYHTSARARADLSMPGVRFPLTGGATYQRRANVSTMSARAGITSSPSMPSAAGTWRAIRSYVAWRSSAHFRSEEHTSELQSRENLV